MQFQGVRALVIEDEIMLSLDLQAMLEDLGCEISGTAARIEEAVALAHHVMCDVAILDLNLVGMRADGVAEILSNRGIPIIFATGYGESAGLSRFRPLSILQKPYDIDLLRQALEALKT